MELNKYFIVSFHVQLLHLHSLSKSQLVWTLRFAFNWLLSLFLGKRAIVAITGIACFFCKFIGSCQIMECRWNRKMGNGIILAFFLLCLVHWIPVNIFKIYWNIWYDCENKQRVFLGPELKLPQSTHNPSSQDVSLYGFHCFLIALSFASIKCYGKDYNLLICKIWDKIFHFHLEAVL